MDLNQRTLSISCTSESLLCTLSHYGSKGIEILDIALIEEAVDFSNSSSDEALRTQLQSLLQSLQGGATKVVVCLAPAALHYSCIPLVDLHEREKLQELLSLEVLQFAPQKSLQDFRALALPLSSGQTQQMLMILSETAVEQRLLQALAECGHSHCEFRIAAQSAYASFAYNYPEKREQTVALVSVDDTELCIGLYSAGDLVFFHTCQLPSAADAAEELCIVLEELLTDRVAKIDTLALYGDHLSPSLIRNIRAGLDERVTEVERLNAFRMCATSMDDAHRQFAGRYAQRFALCVGNVLAPQSPSTTLALDSSTSVFSHETDLQS